MIERNYKLHICVYLSIIYLVLLGRRSNVNSLFLLSSQKCNRFRSYARLCRAAQNRQIDYISGCRKSAKIDNSFVSGRVTYILKQWLA